LPARQFGQLADQFVLVGEPGHVIGLLAVGLGPDVRAWDEAGPLAAPGEVLVHHHPAQVGIGSVGPLDPVPVAVRLDHGVLDEVLGQVAGPAHHGREPHKVRHALPRPFLEGHCDSPLRPASATGLPSKDDLTSRSDVPIHDVLSAE
jgi:hypothetical protein